MRLVIRPQVVAIPASLDGLTVTGDWLCWLERPGVHSKQHDVLTELDSNGRKSLDPRNELGSAKRSCFVYSPAESWARGVLPTGELVPQSRKTWSIGRDGPVLPGGQHDLRRDLRSLSVPWGVGWLWLEIHRSH